MKFSDILISENRITNVKTLYPGKTASEIKSIIYAELKKRLKTAGVIACFCFFLVILVSVKKAADTDFVVTRGDMGSSVSVPVIIKNGDDTVKAELQVSPRKFTDEEIGTMMLEIENCLDSVILNGNEDFEHITGNLSFPADLSGFPVTITWSTADLRIVTSIGTVKNKDIKEPSNTVISAKIDFGSEYRLYEREIIVYPYCYTEEERSVLDCIDSLKKLEEETAYDTEFMIPSIVNGLTVSKEKTDTKVFVLFGILIAVMIVASAYTGYYDRIKKKKDKLMREAEADYREFILKIRLLTLCGMPIRKIFVKLGAEAEKNAGIKKAEGMKEKIGMQRNLGMQTALGTQNLLCDNLIIAGSELKSGMTENSVYFNFADRMNIKCYTRLMGILDDAVKRGRQNLDLVICEEERDAVAAETEKIKIRGEQTGNRLLLPIVGLMLVVFLILIVPALSKF